MLLGGRLGGWGMGRGGEEGGGGIRSQMFLGPRTAHEDIDGGR